MKIYTPSAFIIKGLNLSLHRPPSPLPAPHTCLLSLHDFVENMTLFVSWVDYDRVSCEQHWNRRWFVLDGSKLYYLKDDPSRQKMLICDVLLCTVKVCVLLFFVFVFVLFLKVDVTSRCC